MAGVAETSGDKKGILLETGTNEFEIVEFSIGKVNYGINVAKVREVITRVPVTSMPQAHPYVDGLFTLRGKAIPLVNLPRCLNIQTTDEPRNIIVTEILDFETIIAEINPEINQKLTTFEEATEDIKTRRANVHVVVAEDSAMLRDLLVTTLHDSGYRFVRDFGNGQDAWDYLQGLSKKGGKIEDHVAIIVSDVEMPKMDGHRLLKLVREDERLKEVPLVLFSSLISEEMKRKGEELGASGQISKPEINQLIGLLDNLVFGEPLREGDKEAAAM